MEVLFFAILLGCSDAGTECEPVARQEVSATSPDHCAELTLATDDAMMVDFPVVLAECRPIGAEIMAQAG